LFDRATAATLPENTRVYAVGDTHGCAEQLDALHTLIGADALRAREARKVIVYMGDYLDRGPDSRGVVARLLAPSLPGCERVFLKGNHEAMTLAALAPGATPEVVGFWLDNGGAATLSSYGTDIDQPHAAWVRALPRPHVEFLLELRTAWSCGSYLFAHAGIRPGVAPDAQEEEDLLWIREPFLSSKANHGLVVVHGHTPRQEPTVRPNRIGIDTGAVIGGVLTCVVLEDDKLKFLQA
jgi:serine/threonine protein phosphatase 1